MPESNQNHEGSDKEKLGAKQIVLAIIFGLAFGFLLQKSGVAKYHILIGVLLLQDFTVIKVMLTAVVVSMAGLFILNRLGNIELKLKPTRYGANIVGGLIFGAGFALSGYCPGTGAAALGQMNWDALFVILGMIAGSFLFAESSRWLGKTVQKWGERGKLTLPEVMHLPRPAFVAVFLVLLTVGLWLLERFD
jgi:uncharacterized membrane protein YedE/YeeE